MDLVNLNSFLKFGYFLKYDKKQIKLDFANVDKNRYSGYSRNELIEKGTDVLIKSIDKGFNCNNKHLVPISGGLDSRAILSCLLKFTDASNIYTFTFGTPGTWDYEIGNLIAKKAGTKHISFDLTQHIYTLEEEMYVSKNSNHQTFLFHHPPWFKVLEHFGGFDYWSGYIGDWIAGSYLRENPAKSIEDAKKNIIEKETFVKSINLTNVKDEEYHRLLDLENPVSVNNLSYEEQIEAQNKLIKNTVPNILIDGFRYITPLIEHEWIDFMVSLDNKFRSEENLFKEILINLDSYLFGLPTKTNFGLSLGSNRYQILLARLIRKIKGEVNNIFPVFLNKSVNYLNFGAAINNKENIKIIFEESIIDLKNRKIIEWVDVEKIFYNHLMGKGNYADALIVLASLEIHLKAGKKL